jgi:exodeoxyribonuclease VII large subunit
MAWALAERQARLRGLSPQGLVRSAQQRLDDLQGRAAAALSYRVALERARWQGLDQALKTVSPRAVLARGFALVTKGEGQVVRRAAEVAAGEKLRVQVSEGEFGVRVEEGR